MSRTDAREAVTQAHHDEWARVVASLTRHFGDLDIAEAFATMRHSAATIDLDQGVALAVVREVLGHSDIRVTRCPVRSVATLNALLSSDHAHLGPTELVSTAGVNWL